MENTREECVERSLEEINEILTLAKLDENELLPTSQSVYFTTNNLHDNQYKLLQLDNHLLKSLEEGQTLFITGDDEEQVVICTDSRTYDVVDTETSNSLLLVENLKFNENLKDETSRQISKVLVSGIFYDYLEVIPSKPHLTKLNNILKKSVYKGSEHEHEIKEEDLFTYEDLEITIQASKHELQQALQSMHVVKLNNKIRILDFEYHFRVLSYMLKLIEENSWQLDEIDYEETMNALCDLVPADILNNLFDLYSEESKVIDSLQLYRYKEKEVCRFFAKVLLFSAGKFNLNEFLQAWKESVPDGMIATEEMLYGIAIIDRKSVPNVIWAFNEDTLPDNITDRFKALFTAKEKWTVPEISPYIERLATDQLDVNALLAKYARASTYQGIKYYSSKHAK